MKIETQIKPETSSPIRKISFWNLAVCCLILSGMIVVSSRTIADPDLWGHVRYGMDTIRGGAVMRADPYSYLTAGQPWINHEWLAEIVFAYAWNIAGASGLVALKTLLWVLTDLVLYWYLKKTIQSHLRMGIVLFASMTLTFPFFITVRPQSFSAMLFVLTLVVILQAETGRYRGLWLCPVIYALWPNLHGAFLAGAGIICLWAAFHLVSHRNLATWRQVLPPMLLSGAATLANPYGVGMLTFLFQHISDPRLEIIEWQPMQIHSLTGVCYLLWLGLVLLGLRFSRRPRNPVAFILLFIMAYLPFIGLRYVLFFILAAVLIAGEHIGDAWERVMPSGNASNRRLFAAPVSALIIAILLLAWKWSNFIGIPIKNPEYYPIAAVSLVSQSNATGNLAVHFDWGDYAIWHLTPSMKVSIDTRREMAYAETIYKLNIRFMTGIGNWSALLDDYPTELALVKSATPTDNLMKQRADWIEIYRDEVSVLYSRRDYKYAEELIKVVARLEADTGEKYFP